MNCQKCGQEILLDRKVFRQDTCPQCNSYLHNCYNCRYYERNAHHECRETQADLVHDKDMGNFCDYFEPAAVQQKASSAADETRRKLDQLFNKTS